MLHETLLSRHNIHGDWSSNARITSLLKCVFQEEPGWANLKVEQQEALDLIAVKISRILSGDPFHADHWNGIADYAILAEQSCPPPIEKMINEAVNTLKNNIENIPDRAEQH